MRWSQEAHLTFLYCPWGALLVVGPGDRELVAPHSLPHDCPSATHYGFGCRLTCCAQMARWPRGRQQACHPLGNAAAD